MKRAMPFLAASLALMLCACACASVPDLHVRGQVRDAATGAPIEGARVHEAAYAPALAAGATTDAAGSFSYFTYPEEHFLVVEKEGYIAFRTTIGLHPRSREENLDIILDAEANGR